MDKDLNRVLIDKLAELLDDPTDENVKIARKYMHTLSLIYPCKSCRKCSDVK
ncbi:MAG: Erv1/Alr family FAD-linked sulfhydryl oxidase [Firmicutes bacterium]|nr:Erv1/Alr family FAD-linked sulfhydryl oxidase [Bacillota bacterium]